MRDLPPTAPHDARPALKWRRDRLLSAGLIPLGLVVLIGLGVQFAGDTGVLRIAVLIAALAQADWLIASPPRVRPFRAGMLTRAFFALAAAHGVYLLSRFWQGHVAAAGNATMVAAKLLLHGLNPYAEAMDPVGGLSPAFSGYKYLPVMAVIYAPLVYVANFRGVLVTNFILDMAVAGLVVALARKIGAELSAALAAGVAYLTMAFIIGQIYAKGETDVLPVALMLGALLLGDTMPTAAGLLAGLSISSKLVPAAAALPALMPARGRYAFALGLGLGLIPTAVAIWSAPLQLYNNIVLFNISRNQSGFLTDLPAFLAPAAKIALILCWIVVSGLALWLRPNARARGLAAIILLNVTILAGAVIRKNYNIWWAPLLCVGAVAPAAAHDEADRRRETSPSL